MSRDEMFQLVRWVNLAVGIVEIMYWWNQGPIYLLGIGALNIAAWAFTRKVK